MTFLASPSALAANDGATNQPARSASCACDPCTCAQGGQQCMCGDTAAQACTACAASCTCATCHCA
ncbi:hypothetical protein WG902_14895 [Ramlibacter sp. PS3R-8]|uniref:hypothetical protein n=1 Tax=Ramlibacter sp. PS3R-8 TaxID=3133437 RepID=UPI0030986926